MKKFGFLFALIAVLAMGTSAFAASEVASQDIRLVLSDDSGTWDAGKGFRLISNDKVLQIISTDALKSYDVSFTMYAGQKASLKAYVTSTDVYKDAEFDGRAPVAGFLSRDNIGAGVDKVTVVMSPDVSEFNMMSAKGSMDVHVSGDIFGSSSNGVISPDVKVAVTFVNPLNGTTAGTVSFSKNNDKGLASKDVPVSWMFNGGAAAPAKTEHYLQNIIVAYKGAVSADVAAGTYVNNKFVITVSMDKVASNDVISYDATAVLSGDNGDGKTRKFTSSISGKFVITSSDTPGPGPTPDPDPVKPGPQPVNASIIPDGNTTLVAPQNVVSASADVKALITTDEGKKLMNADGTVNTSAAKAELEKQRFVIVTGSAVVTPEPFKAEIATEGKVGLVQVDVAGKFNDLSKVKFVKLKADGKLEVSNKWAKKIGDLGDKGFTFVKADGITLADKSADVKFLVIAIKDNGDFDLDKTAKKIMDPAMFAEMNETHKGGSSSGCSAGYAPFALLLAAPLFFFRKRG